MGQLVYILGKPGTGKTYSLRNIDKNTMGVISVAGKILSFGKKNFDTGEPWPAWGCEVIYTDDSDEITAAIKKMSRKYKVIIVDDFQYVMANEFMRRSTERGYDKFTDIGRHAWDIANTVRELDPDVIVYVLCHTDTDQDGFEKLKTIGKLLDEKIFLEGMSTIVLKTHVEDGKYTFLTQNNGHDTVKSPAGMFPAYAIDNDLHYVDEKIRSYYEIGDFKTDEEMEAADAAAAHDEIQKEEPKKKRGKKKEEKPAEAPAEVEKEAAGEEEPAEKYPGAKGPYERARAKVAAEKDEKEKPAPGARSRRISQTLKEEREQVMKENMETLVNVPEGEDSEVPFEEKGPELKPLPKRKGRKKAEEDAAPAPVEEPAEDPEEALNKPVRRRGRRRG